jgi:hypothetical protein
MVNQVCGWIEFRMELYRFKALMGIQYTKDADRQVYAKMLMEKIPSVDNQSLFRARILYNFLIGMQSRHACQN